MIKELLTNNIEMQRQIGHPALLERFIRLRGVHRTMAIDAKRGQPKRCFANALHFALANDAQYVEGYAIWRGLDVLIHHAWCQIGEHFLDPTWNDPQDCEYLGVAFEANDAVSRALRNGAYGLFVPKFTIDFELIRELDLGGALNSELLREGFKLPGAPIGEGGR